MSEERKGKVFHCAKYFIYLAHKEGKRLTNKKLQKLVYYAQAWSLVLNDKSLFEDPIQAWVHGPAVANLYREYAKHGFNPIEVEVAEKDIDIPQEGKKLIREVWNIYGSFDAQYLETLSHYEKPWQKAREGLDATEPSGIIITNETMKEFYGEKLKKTQVEKQKA